MAPLKMQMTNKVANQLFGYTKTELRGKNISMLLPPVIAEQHAGYIRNYITTGARSALLASLIGRLWLLQHLLGPVAAAAQCQYGCSLL
jgi:hypothetical protein